MKAIKTLVPFARRHGIRVSFAVTLLLAAGCAHVPRLGPSPTMKSVEELGAAQAFAAPAATWPGDGWWRAYGDLQLDELIEEALRGAPDLALAQSRLEAAAAAVTFAGAARIPEVTGSAALIASRLDRLWVGHVGLFLGTGLLGQEPIGSGSRGVGSAGRGLRVRGDAFAHVDFRGSRLCGAGGSLHRAG